ncbi:MAG: hypothetical protein A2Y00_00340 [Omnitrophica WOR_2 bacterium GWF2_43_52]|nr:MAG: hypothetical protein A2Y00_00340 [Omnitrophica WOR_2 bacterium GWF2_43_52]OGX57077.1 MAG: hypothetical protein A2460_09055 [Omnitrophica WOR_2 bacterium RIFOXYC2_FULL_43_9]HAH21090.1 hypothetical protein [Candidatus Omnitrophota bacterium]HBG63308.1 hypothetical protein [Candidatus Omnitrophota bacterium]HCD38113.1 hypothetical protein [Candidatus Omnitrophota bacterium]
MEKDIALLIVDDTTQILETLGDILTEEGYAVTTASSAALAKKSIAKKFFHAALIDLRLDEGTGLDLLKAIKKANEDTMVIIFTAFASLESTLSAMREGAFGYLQKPLNVEELKITLAKALKTQALTLENRRLVDRLKELSLKDPLTGLYNYRYLIERLVSEFKRAKRYILPLSVIMLDVDYFKSINEVYGHQYGDEILREFADYLKNNMRVNDVAIRYGGEEFIILMPDTYKEGAVIVGERLLEMLKEYVFDPKGKSLKLRISMGVASYPENGIETPSELLDAIDKALHEAKDKGGNVLIPYQSISAKEVKDILKDGGKENVEKLKKKLLKMEDRTNQMLLESIFAFAKAVEVKDYYTGKHSESMVSIATEIGKDLHLSSEEIDMLQHAAILHDLGKIGIQDKILHKRSSLTEKEREKIKRHPQIGAEIVRNIHFLKEIVPMILYHHERFDGFGYTSGLKGKEIPLGARIIAIADVYQALISDRSYRKACTKKEALKIIEEGSGTQFDPEIVEVFLKTMKERDERRA